MVEGAGEITDIPKVFFFLLLESLTPQYIYEQFKCLSEDSVANKSGRRGGGDSLSATLEKIDFFFLKREKDAECSETENYVFC